MTRTGRRWIGGEGRAGVLQRLFGIIRPTANLPAIALLLMATAGESGADLLPEMRAIDAQIARGVIGPAEPDPESGPFAEPIRTIIPDADQNCLRIADAQLQISDGRLSNRPRTAAQIDLETALRQVRWSEMGAWLVQAAAARDVTVCLDRATGLEAHYRSHLRLLGLNARLSPAGRVVFLAHELAHVPQHPRFSNNRQFSPGHMLLLQRAREAAAEAVATRVLWQLRQQGIATPWKEKLATAYHDIAEAFEVAMADGHGAARELWATRTAFHHWFVADWRRDIYDDLMLKTLARIADDPIGLIPASRHLSDRYLRGIADYAGQSFLIDGDGRALINGFHVQGLTAGGQARLETILARAANSPARTHSSLAGEALSAISPEASAAKEN